MGAEPVIHAGDLRRCLTVIVGMIACRGGTTALSDLPTDRGLARSAGPQRAIEECRDSRVTSRGCPVTPPGAQTRLSWADRAVFAALTRLLSPFVYGIASSPPATILRWHRDVVKRRWTQPRSPRSGGRRTLFLVRDRDSKFIASLMPCSPARARIATARRELLDRMLIINRHHLMAVLTGYVTHFNDHRPHRALNQAARLRSLPLPASPSQFHLQRRELLDGLIHE